MASEGGRRDPMDVDVHVDADLDEHANNDYYNLGPRQSQQQQTTQENAMSSFRPRFESSDSFVRTRMDSVDSLLLTPSGDRDDGSIVSAASSVGEADGHLAAAAANPNGKLSHLQMPLMGTIEGGARMVAQQQQPNHLPRHQFYDSDTQSENGSVVFGYVRGSTTPPATYDLPKAIVRGRAPYPSSDASSSRPVTPQSVTPMGAAEYSSGASASHRSSPTIPEHADIQTLPYYQRQKQRLKQQAAAAAATAAAQQQQQSGTSATRNNTVFQQPQLHAESPGYAQQQHPQQQQVQEENDNTPLRKNRKSGYRSMRPSKLGTIQNNNRTEAAYHVQQLPPQRTSDRRGGGTPPSLPSPPQLPPSGGHKTNSSSQQQQLQPSNRNRTFSDDSNNASTEMGTHLQQHPPPPLPPSRPRVGPGGGQQQQRSQHSPKDQQPPQQYHIPPFSGGGVNTTTNKNDNMTNSSVGNNAPGGVTSFHIRADSSGSVSSLGSTASGLGNSQGGFFSLTDRLKPDISSFLREHSTSGGDSANRNSNRKRRSGSGIFGDIFGNNDDSPRTVEEEQKNYHKKNQAFLHKAERERAKMHNTLRDLSPNQRLYVRSSTPPNSRGAHRPGLASIDNDIWDDDGEDGVPASHRGRTSKHPKSHYHNNGQVATWNSTSSSSHRKKSNSDKQSYKQQQEPRVFDAEKIRDRHNDFEERPSKEQRRAESIRHSSSASGSLQYSVNTRSGPVHPRSSGRSQNHMQPMTDSSDEVSSSDGFISSDGEDSYFDITSDRSTASDADDLRDLEVGERTSLLAPAGISTHENGQRYSDEPKTKSVSRHGKRSSRRSQESLEEGRRWKSSSSSRRNRGGHRESNKGRHDDHRRSQKKDGRRREKDHYDDRRNRRRDLSPTYNDSQEDSDNRSSNSSDYRKWAKKAERKLEREKDKMIARWKIEARAEAEKMRKEEEERRWYNRLRRWFDAEMSFLLSRITKFLLTVETFFSNLPLTIGAVALSIACLGVVWFKFAEENLESCSPVHFHSSQCSFPEFPGCFYCDTHVRLYKIAVNFHFACSAIAGLLAMSVVAKVMLAWRVVVDEMSSPTTSSPAGLLCMTTVCVFAGRGMIGQFLVSAAATVHLCLAGWFIYMALAYHIMPEPSWYPNTVGIGLSAVKTWLYYPVPGHFLMAISLSLNFFFFPISIIRVAVNKKISAPVCWIQMSAPAISLYALTIMAQPSFQEEQPDVTDFQQLHRMVYLPCMHLLFVLAIVGMLSSLHSLWARWESFSKREFSPAHAAFCFPTLAHANAVQAYRGAVDAFSDVAAGSPFKVALYSYWILVLVAGTITTVVITTKFFRRLPSWTQVDITDEEEPPAPNQTMMRDVIQTGEIMLQSFVSPAVLQANETGALVRLRRGGEDGRGRYVRTRKVTALGFEPMMGMIEMATERDILLDYVSQHPPRARKRTLSVPGIDFNYGYAAFGTGNTGVFDSSNEGGPHSRGQSLGYQARVRAHTFGGRS